MTLHKEPKEHTKKYIENQFPACQRCPLLDKIFDDLTDYRIRLAKVRGCPDFYGYYFGLADYSPTVGLLRDFIQTLWDLYHVIAAPHSEKGVEK